MSENILIVGDSLGLPREEMPYKKTWPFLMANSLQSYHFIFKIQRALTTQMLHLGMFQDWLEYYTPKDVIMQVGIVDCAPRYLKKSGLKMKLLGVSPGFIKNSAWKLIKKSGRSAKYADVSIEEFEANLLKYISRCEKANVERIFFIKIARPGTAMIKSNPGVIKQVELYNTIYDKIAVSNKKCIVISDLAQADDNYFLEDGYHLNEYGNNILFQSILKHYN